MWYFAPQTGYSEAYLGNAGSDSLFFMEDGGPTEKQAVVLTEALNVHEQTGLTPAQLQARVAELEGARHRDDERTDFSLKEGDVVERDGWTLTKLTVVDVNWALGAAALRLGASGDVVVWSVVGLRRA